MTSASSSVEKDCDKTTASSRSHAELSHRYTKEEEENFLRVLASFQKKLPDGDLQNAYTTASWQDIATAHNSSGYNRNSASIRSLWYRKYREESLSPINKSAKVLNDKRDIDYASSAEESTTDDSDRGSTQADDLLPSSKYNDDWNVKEEAALEETVKKLAGSGDITKKIWTQIAQAHNAKGYRRTVGGINKKWSRLEAAKTRKVQPAHVISDDSDSDDMPLM